MLFPEYHNETSTKILNVLIQMKKDNKSHYTINFTRKALSYLAKHTNLAEPEAVKLVIAELKTSDGYKRNLCIAYNKYAKFCGITWTMPKYREPAKNIALPTREKIQMLIADAGELLGMKLTLSMETGLRPIELCNLKTKDIDLDQNRIHPTTAKHGSARTLKISNNLQKTLKDHITEHKLNTNDKLFKGNAENYAKYYRATRNRLANKLHNPTIKTIRLYDLRHFYATMEYAKTKDILHVKQQMGHKKIETTLIYTQLLNLNDDEWTCKATNNTKDATAVVESGFEYVATTPDGLMLFRKRK
jgi:integrase